MTKTKVLYIAIGFIAVLVLWSFSSYNSLVKSNIAVDTSWAQVEVQYQRRFDLIPNLVSAVQGQMKQEKDVFTGLALARQGYAGAKTIDQKIQATGQVESALGRLLVITENYPDLKSAQGFSDLRAELAGTENRVSVERSRFNQTVSAYNTNIKTFPGNIFAGMFGFVVRPLFTAAVDAQVVPKVDFTK